ncbi:hypothetical protein NE237_024853 [Protea cynaroides]|uniref:Uncharacterized protein n=1 Tax=Protea cynaroides TaxID=273540 RepID=A0A9Q0H0T6_9MAGN|nr:hypothetical protein NE237_024853 [Protea cynaroides]
MIKAQFDTVTKQLEILTQHLLHQQPAVVPLHVERVDDRGPQRERYQGCPAYPSWASPPASRASQRGSTASSHSASKPSIHLSIGQVPVSKRLGRIPESCNEAQARVNVMRLIRAMEGVIKFPTDHGTGDCQGDQKISRQCYLIELGFTEKFEGQSSKAGDHQHGEKKSELLKGRRKPRYNLSSWRISKTTSTRSEALQLKNWCRYQF